METKVVATTSIENKPKKRVLGSHSTSKIKQNKIIPKQPELCSANGWLKKSMRYVLSSGQRIPHLTNVVV